MLSLNTVLWVKWPFRVLAVGLFCAGIQWLVMVGLVTLGLSHLVGNLLGFFLSAQINFLLSYHITWIDRKDLVQTGQWQKKYVQFNLLAGTILVFNSLAFILAAAYMDYQLAFIGGLGGTGIGWAFNCFVQHRYIFQVPVPPTVSGQYQEI